MSSQSEEGRVALNEKDTGSPPTELERVENAAMPNGVDPETEKALLKKLDRRLIPMICWIYLMNFMDRGLRCTFG